MEFDRLPSDGISSVDEDEEGGYHLHEHVPADRWCITREGFEVFEKEVRDAWGAGKILDDPSFPNEGHDDPKIGPTLHQVIEYFIKRTTERNNIYQSYALLQQSTGYPAHFFVTHTWDEGVFEFCSKCRRSWPRGSFYMWCSFISQPQEFDTSQVLREGELMNLPFAIALGSAKTMVLIPNRFTSIYSNLWCLVEIKMAIDRRLRIIICDEVPLSTCFSYMVIPMFLHCLLAAGMYYCQFKGRKEDVYDYVGMLISTVLAGAFFFFRNSKQPLAHASSSGALLGCATGILLYRWKGSRSILDARVYAGMVVLFQVLCITRILKRLRRNLGGKSQLDFTSVRDARCLKCLNTDEEALLLKAISGQEDEIDEAIQLIKAVGCYAPWVQNDLDMGFDPAKRQPLSITQALLVCVIWAYFYVVLASECGFKYGIKVGYNMELLVIVFTVIANIVFLGAIAQKEPRTRRIVHAVKAEWMFGLGLLCLKALTDMLEESGTAAVYRLDIFMGMFGACKFLLLVYIWCYVPMLPDQSKKPPTEIEATMELELAFLPMPETPSVDRWRSMRDNRKRAPRWDMPRRNIDDHAGLDESAYESPWLRNLEGSQPAPALTPLTPSTKNSEKKDLVAKPSRTRTEAPKRPGRNEPSKGIPGNEQ